MGSHMKGSVYIVSGLASDRSHTFAVTVRYVYRMEFFREHLLIIKIIHTHPFSESWFHSCTCIHPYYEAAHIYPQSKYLIIV